MNTIQLTLELQKILPGSSQREQLLKDYQKLKEILTSGGDASATAAKSIYEFVKNE
jgi:lipid-A-disaccharide synthase